MQFKGTGQLDLHKQHRPFLKLSFKTSNSFYHLLVSLENLLVPTFLQLFLFPIIEIFFFPSREEKINTTLSLGRSE